MEPPCHIHSHLGAPGKTGVKAEEESRTSISPANLDWSGRELPTPYHPAQEPRSLAQPSLTHTGAVVGPQLEAWLTLAAKGARQVHTAMLAVAVAALVYVWDGGRTRRAEDQSQEGPQLAGTPVLTTRVRVCVWALGWARTVRTHTYTQTVLCLVTRGGRRLG